MVIDGHLPNEDFYGNASLEIFPTIFKLTFYGEDHSVINGDPSIDGYLNAMVV